MSIRHHVTDELLFEYASGNLGFNWSLAIATHLAMCPDCRATLARMEDLGAEALMDLEPVAMSSVSPSEIIASAENEPISDRHEETALPDAVPPTFPEPLRSHAGDLDDIKWQPLGGGLKQKILGSEDGATARLLYIPPGRSVPAHGHNGLEFTLVLKGSFDDGQMHFGPGDIEIVDHAAPHQPKAAPGDPCICLAVTDAPLRFQGFIPRLFQPVFKI